VDEPERIGFLSAVLINSSQPERLASFYREILGLPLEDEHHGNTSPHYGCELGDVHFAIHPRPDAPSDGPIRLAFWVFDLVALVERLVPRGVELRYPVRQLGPNSLMTAIFDPDGNEIELTQMGDDWVDHLAAHRSDGADVIQTARRSAGKRV
jgi:catechol 2,3-dioxygenase-like lactoylglutathione lyase family enzyme